MTKSLFTKERSKDYAILIATGFESFDTAIYGFLAPVLAPIFFPDHDYKIQLILGYSVLATKLLTKPVGVLIFARLANLLSPAIALLLSITGASLTSAFTALLPTYALLGATAPALLVISRMLCSLFAAGAKSITKLYILEDKDYKGSVKASYLYQMISMIGIVLASLLSSCVISLGIEWLWRICFLFGCVIGIIAAIILSRTVLLGKRKVPELFPKRSNRHLAISTIPNARLNQTNDFKSEELGAYIDIGEHLETHKNRLDHLKMGFGITLRIVSLVSFSHITYTLPFILMNSFVPLITSISLDTMMAFNTGFLVFDILMFPALAPLLHKYKPYQLMLFASFALLLTIVPLWHFIEGSSILYVSFVRLWIVFLGVIFALPLNILCKELTDNLKDQYIVIGMGNIIGAGLGSITPFVCLSLFQITGSASSILWYIIFIIVCALSSLARYK